MQLYFHQYQHSKKSCKAKKKIKNENRQNFVEIIRDLELKEILEAIIVFFSLHIREKREFCE